MRCTCNAFGQSRALSFHLRIGETERREFFALFAKGFEETGDVFEIPF